LTTFLNNSPGDVTIVITNEQTPKIKSFVVISPVYLMLNDGINDKYTYSFSPLTCEPKIKKDPITGLSYLEPTVCEISDYKLKYSVSGISEPIFNQKLDSY
jgi:hypothetical protein